MKSNKGFTLIELLVVIAIIAILAAILFPVFAQAREKARAITCVSNEKEIGLAMLQYTQDNDEAFPMLQYYDAQNNPLDWYLAVLPYIKNGTVLTGNGGNKYFLGQGGVWSCPSFPGPQEANYGINWELCRNGSGTWAASQPGFVQVIVNSASVDSPADKIMAVEKGYAAPIAPGQSYAQALFDPNENNFTNCLGLPALAGTDTHNELHYDADVSSAGTYTDPVTNTTVNGANWNTTPGNMPRFRHQGTCNTLFIDGHVKAVHKGQMNWVNNIYIQGVYESLPATPC